jgi:hypothetical protein
MLCGSMKLHYFSLIFGQFGQLRLQPILSIYFQGYMINMKQSSMMFLVFVLGNNVSFSSICMEAKDIN